MSRSGEPRWTVLVTMLIALGIQVVPLPDWLSVVRPPFLVLVVLYWSISAPRAGGIFVAWIAGLALDVFKGAVLGQHALAVSLVAYVTILLHQRLRNQPVIQQALFIFAMLALYELVVFFIDGWTGHRITSFWRWTHPVIGACMWPIATLLLGRTHAPR